MIEHTPFSIVGTPEEGYFLAFGKHKLTDVKKTKEEVPQLLNSHTWEIITNLVIVLIETVEKFKQLDLKNSQQ